MFVWLGFLIKTIKHNEKFHIKSVYCSCLVLKIEFPLHNGGLPTTNLKVFNKDRFTHTGHVTNIFLFKMYSTCTEMHLKVQKIQFLYKINNIVTKQKSMFLIFICEHTVTLLCIRLQSIEK